MFFQTLANMNWHVNFAKFVKILFLQNTTGRLLLIKSVSIVVKGELANETVNKRNDKRFNNCGYLLLFLMGIFLKHIWLIPNILKWHDCKIFTNVVPSQTPSRSSHLRCSVKKVFLKICEVSQETLLKRACKFIKKRLQHTCFSCEICEIFKNTYLEEHLQTTASLLLGFAIVIRNVFPFLMTMVLQKLIITSSSNFRGDTVFSIIT